LNETVDIGSEHWDLHIIKPRMLR